MTPDRAKMNTRKTTRYETRRSKQSTALFEWGVNYLFLKRENYDSGSRKDEYKNYEIRDSTV
jgi:hypothetical protein